MYEPELARAFDYENGFYLTASEARIGKFAAHLDLFRLSSGLPGEIVECGVFKGASLSRFIKFRALLENTFSRKIIAFDVFGDFPEADYPDDVAVRAQFVQAAGESGIALNTFEQVLQGLNLDANIQLVRGDVRKTVPSYMQTNPQLKISLLHIDVDLFEATKVCLDTLYPHVVSGGIVILDDYGAFSGANKAIDAYFKDADLRVERLPYASAISFVRKP